MGTLPWVLMFIKRCTVKTGKAVGVGREMGRDPVEYYTYIILVAEVNKDSMGGATSLPQPSRSILPDPIATPFKKSLRVIRFAIN